MPLKFKIFIVILVAFTFFFLSFTLTNVFASCTSAGLNGCGIGQTSCQNPSEGALCCTVPGEACQLPTSSIGSKTTVTTPTSMIPCGSDLASTDPEFHSLRPYPAKPCVTQIVSSAPFCGNDLTLHDTVTVYYPGSENYLTSKGCTTAGGKIDCTYSVPVTKPVTINLTGANLPFAGNTENVPNSQSKTGTSPPLSDTDKVNGYVSWYLNGVENRPEDSTTENTDYNTVNLSGPINKLLPSAILDAQRIQTINNAVGATATNHNQIVVCGQSKLGIIGDITKLGSVTPVNCYAGNNTPALGEVSLPGQVVMKLQTAGKTIFGNDYDGWNGSLSIWDSFINDIVNKISALLPTVGKDVIRNSIGNHWNKRTPPLPWSDENGKPFASEILYQKAYNEWKGQTCVIVPIVNMLVCFNNILVPNRYADLYPYIPLSSTEDLQGSIKIDNVSSVTNPATGGVNVTGVRFDNQTPSTLFFPHMTEDSQLADLLQSTFVASSETSLKTAAPTDVSQTSCSTVEVRSNKGDSLFAKSLTGTLNYTTSFSCEFDYPTCVRQSCGSCCAGASCNLGIGICQQQLQTCTKDVYISLSTSGQIPEIDNLWSQLVAGPEAIFKRIFPKTNTEGGVGKIIDIPGSTNITYTGTGGVGVTQQSTDLKFPHLGGISEYFLNGIQTALRPKGFGNPITFDPNSKDKNPVFADVCSPSCNPDPTKIDMTGVEQRFLDLANRWYGITGKPRVDMYDTVVNSAIAGGVDPIFALEDWLNESGASDYAAVCTKLGGGDPTSQYCQQVLDFGVFDQNIITTFNPNGTVIADHLVDQLKAFLLLPGFYISSCGHVNKCDLETWGAMFAPGQCARTIAGNAHVASAMQIYGWLAPPGQKFPCYPAKVP